MGKAFDIHNQLGCKWNEVTYQVELADQLSGMASTAEREVPIQVEYGRFRKTYRLDLVVGDGGIYELKTVNAIGDAHVGQVLNYLRLLNATRAKIVNFRTLSVDSRFVNCNDTIEERRRFDIDSVEYRGPTALRNQVVGMVSDLGTKLSVTLYNDCVLANVGEATAVPIGTTRATTYSFQTINETEAFVVTAIERKHCHHREHLRKMVKAARLTAFHWINVTPQVVRLETITL